MRKLLGTATAVALALAAGAGSAAQWTGTIEEIDEISRDIMVSNSARPDRTMTFAVSDINTAGATIEDLQEGDTVRVFYAATSAEGTAPVNAMQIDRVEIGAWQGPVEGVDETARRVVLDGEEYVVADAAFVGVPLSELREGDEVWVVFQEAGGDREVVEITKVEIRQGTLEQIGGDSITVEGTEYPLLGGYQGVPLGELEEGDEVRLVLGDTDPRDIVELTRAE